MANLLGAAGPEPREYSRHQRHSKLARRRYSNSSVRAQQLGTFLTAQATRLSSTSALIFAKLLKNTAARIRAASTFGSLS